MSCFFSTEISTVVLFRITALEILFLGLSGLVCLNDLVEDDASSSVAAPKNCVTFS